MPDPFPVRMLLRHCRLSTLLPIMCADVWPLSRFASRCSMRMKKTWRYQPHELMRVPWDNLKASICVWRRACHGDYSIDQEYQTPRCLGRRAAFSSTQVLFKIIPYLVTGTCDTTRSQLLDRFKSHHIVSVPNYTYKGRLV